MVQRTIEIIESLVYFAAQKMNTFFNIQYTED